MKKVPKTLEKYFKKKFKSLPNSLETIQILGSLLSKVPKSMSKIFATSVLYRQNRDDFKNIRTQFLGSNEIFPSWAEFIRENIKNKYAEIEELEKNIENTQEKIGIIEQYEEYLTDHRKNNFSEKIEPISYYKNEKQMSVEYLNSLVKDKKNFFKIASDLAESIQVLYKEIEEDQVYLDEINEKLLKIKKIHTNKKIKKHSEVMLRNLSPGQDKLISEISEIKSKIELSTSRSQNSLNVMTINLDSLNFSEVPGKIKKNLTLKIKDPRKIVEIQPKVFVNDNIVNSLVKSKTSKFNIGELSRTNQERLAIIEDRLRCGEAIHGLISPKLERMKKQEKEHKELIFSNARIPNYAQIPEKYKKLSPRQVKTLNY